MSFKKLIYFISIFLILLSNVSYSLTMSFCEMSINDNVCACKHDNANFENSTADISISVKHNVYCEYFVKDYSNNSDFKVLEKTNYNNIFVVNYFPVILQLRNKAVLNLHSASDNNFHKIEIPILYSSLLI